MTFGNPLFLWAFVSLIPLIAIYLLKVRPRRKPTTAYFLWNDIVQERRSNSLFQRFRDLFSLLLMALAFAAVVLALAKPEWNQLSNSDFVLIIDNTASMNSSDGMGTRLDTAKRSAQQIVEALDGNQRCSIATMSTKITYLSNLTDNPRELSQAIDSIQPTTLPFHDSALSQFRREQQEPTTEADAPPSTESDPSEPDVSTARIVLISDGQLGSELPDHFELMKVGASPVNNCGIVACDMQRQPGRQKATVFCQLASSYSETIDAEITVTFETTDSLAKLIPVSIRPGTNPPLLFEVENAIPGKWRLELDVDDSLQDDNQAFLVLQPTQRVPIQVESADRYFYENSVLAFSEAGGILNLVETDGAILIRQGAATDASAANSDLLIFRPEGDSIWWEDIGEEIEVALPRAIQSDHPVIRHIDIASIPFMGARRVRAPSAAEILVEAEDGTPLIWRMSNAGTSAVVVNLNPMDANFYFSAWFPILVYSSATHLAGRTESIPATIATGSTSFIPNSKPGQKNKLVDPQQDSITVTGDRTPALNQIGFYDLSTPGGTWNTSASLLNKRETLNDNREIKGSNRPIKKGWSPVGWLTALAVVILVTESLLYQRRKVG